MKFSVIYTHHKTQKRKIWKDGYLKVDTNFKKATLHEEGGNQLDLKWLSGVKISAGDELDLPRYLVQVEHPDLGGDTGVVKATVAKADNSTSNIENVLVGDQQEHLRQTYGDKNEDSRLPKFELKPFIRHKVPNGSTSLNDQPQPIPEISSATSRPSGRIKTSPKSDDPSAHRLDLSVVAHRHDRNLGLSRIAKPTIDFLCFSPEAVYRTSQEVGEPPVHFDSFEAYQTYHINLLEEYIQSILEELYQKLKLKLGEFGEQASKSMGSKATEFRLFSNGEVRVFASGSFPTEPPKSKVDVGFDGSRVPPRCESVQIALQGSYNNSEFSKDDLWILSTKLSFPLEETVVLRSLYHGVSGGKIHVSFTSLAC